MNSTFSEIKATIKGMGYAFNRYWAIKLPSGNYIENSKLGGWNGMELWCRGENGLDSRLADQSEAFQQKILDELRDMQSVAR